MGPQGLPSKKFMAVSTMVVVGIFLILLGLGMVPSRSGSSFWITPIAGASELGVLVIVLAFVAALLWEVYSRLVKPGTLK